MASLRDTVKDYQEDLRDGIAWVAFWKTGRSWNAEYFHLEMGDYLYPEDRSRMEEIKQTDPAAVVVNGYYSGYLGEDMSLDELTAGVRRHYENGYSNIGEFIEAHDDRLPPELIEEARAAAHAAGLPFSEKAYRDGEEPDPYIFDGSMSMEDYELMHRMIENERSERMAETILSGYLSNLGKYTEGMVCLNDIPVNGNLAKIRRHVPGGDELHFLLNQCPFFLCYIEFDLYFSFASVHAIAPFRFEGLGHFPTSNFQPTHRRTGGRKYGKGYSFPMLATKVFSSLVTTTQCSICQKRAKEKRCNL